MRPYYRKAGRYKDGRSRIVIEKLINKKVKQFALPKPEKMLEILHRLKSDKITH
jgi:hypothetical protein